MSDYLNDPSSVSDEQEQARLYTKPAIIHELKLETRAGSPLGTLPNPQDPLGMTSGSDPV